MSPSMFFYQMCPVCGRSVSVRVQYLGQKLRCGHCQGLFIANGDADEVGRRSRRTWRPPASLRTRYLGRTLDDQARTLLLLEPQTSLRDRLSEHLTDRGYRVTAVHHPRLAMHAMAISPRSFVVMDRRLPEYDEAYVMHTLKTFSSDVRIIVLIGPSDQLERAELMKEGAFACVAPSHDLSLLDETLAIARRSLILDGAALDEPRRQQDKGAVNLAT